MLSVSVVMHVCLDAILIGDIEDTDEVLQKLRRINCEKTAGDARGIIYVLPTARKAAEKLLANHEAGTSKPGQTPPDLSMPRLTLADANTKQLLELCLEILRNSDQSKYWLYLPDIFFPDCLIAAILDCYVQLCDLPSVTEAIKLHPLLAAYLNCILEVLQELKPEFNAVAANRKAGNAVKLKMKKAEEASLQTVLESDNDLVEYMQWMMSTLLGALLDIGNTLLAVRTLS
ncbi:hypothetical protein C8J57DRAFT_1250095 [Mycena rebaudengoi]|nr:hypothetical protein C8J57DRAFT_1250095 [Mycena rebaudengoi]